MQKIFGNESLFFFTPNEIIYFAFSVRYVFIYIYLYKSTAVCYVSKQKGRTDIPPVFVFHLIAISGQDRTVVGHTFVKDSKTPHDATAFRNGIIAAENTAF